MAKWTKLGVYYSYDRKLLHEKNLKENLWSYPKTEPTDFKFLWKGEDIKSHVCQK